MAAVLKLMLANTGGSKDGFDRESPPQNTLQKFVKEKKYLRPQIAASIIFQILDLLEGFRQKDLFKVNLHPENILVQSAEEYPFFVKVTEILKTTFVDDPRKLSLETRMIALTQFGQMLGEPHYVAPERIRGQTLYTSSNLYSFLTPEQKQIREQTFHTTPSLYSLSALLFFMLTGQPPFSDKESIQVTIAQLTKPFPPLNTFSHCQHLPDTLQKLVDKGSQKKPADRFQSAQEFRCALRNALLPSF